MVSHRPPRGFTLVELLVATAVSIVALGLAVLLLHPPSVAFRVLPESIEEQQRLRVAVRAVADAIGEAGAGPSLGWGARARPAWPAVLPCRFLGGPLGQLAGGCARDDAITVRTVGVTAPQAILAADVADVGAAIRVAPLSACDLSRSACRMHAGAQMLMADGTGAWDVVSISSVSADGTLVEHAGTPFSRAYAAGAIAGEVESAAFSVQADASSDVPILRRSANGAAEMPVVDHVTALRFEYFGEAAAPQVFDDTDGDRRRASYGPLPPPAGYDNALDAWLPGENCLFSRDNGLPVARLVSLPVEESGLARLPLAAFTDGPWCPDGLSSNRFDADLLRVRLVRITLRVQAGSPSVRGADPLLFSHPGSARDSARLVPDLEVRADVALRNAPR
jgi:hypothetical protein